jgi:hypothetical protein
MVEVLGPMQDRQVRIRQCRRRLNLCSLSSIIICRFHLDLQRRNAHPNTNTSPDLPTISIGSFHAATQRIHDAVMAEFGDSNADLPVGTEEPSELVEAADGAIVEGTTDNDIALVEIQSRPQPEGADMAA